MKTKTERSFVIVRKKPAKHIRVDWSKVIVDKNMYLSGDEMVEKIYRDTGVKVTRQNIYQTLKIAMAKFYRRLMVEDSTLSPFQAAVCMMYMLNMPHANDVEMEKFFMYFPQDVKREIREDAKNFYPKFKDKKQKREKVETQFTYSDVEILEHIMSRKCEIKGDIAEFTLEG